MDKPRTRAILLVIGAFSLCCYIFLSYQSAQVMGSGADTEALRTAVSGGGLSLPDVQLIKKAINIALQLLPAY